MCYRIVSHSARCDVRTIVVGATENEAYVDPYARPRDCSCETADSGIKPWLRCPHHKCCRINTRWRRCNKVTGDELCTVPIPYHKYEQARSATCDPGTHNDLSAITYNFWNDISELDFEIGLFDDGDEGIMLNSELFDTRRSMMLCYGRLIFESLLETLRAQQEIEAIQSTTQCDHHHICERVLQGWECPASRAETKIQEINERLCQLEENREGYRAEFLRWKTWLVKMIWEGEGHCSGLMLDDIVSGSGQTNTKSAGRRKPQLFITIPRIFTGSIHKELTKTAS